MSNNFDKLLGFLKRLPAIDLPAGRKSKAVANSIMDTGGLSLLFILSIQLAWRHIQKLGHVLNSISIEDRLPTLFMPVSSPPYSNGGEDFLSWVIESTEPDFPPDTCAEWLEGRLPKPVDDINQWSIEEYD